MVIKKPGVQPGHWGPQSGKPVSVSKDKTYLAMGTGLRISKTGHPYYEYRANRSDMSKKKRL